MEQSFERNSYLVYLSLLLKANLRSLAFASSFFNSSF